MQFLYGHWVKLPLTTRVSIATAFGIPKTSSTHVVDNQIQSDGYKIADVENALNIDKLQSYLNSTETDFQVLWDLLIAKTEGRETTSIPVIEEPKKKRGRPAKVKS